MKKITFKRHPKETGLGSVVRPCAMVDLKIGGKIIGCIAPPSAFTKEWIFKIRLKIVETEYPIGWKWIELKFKSKTEQEARDFIIKNSTALQEKYNFYFRD
jgi:hypothetical protein